MTLAEAIESERGRSDFEVWPDNWLALHIFSAMATQWRPGMAGATGLIYSELPFVLEMKGIARDEWPELFADLQVMEAAGLDHMRQVAERQRRKK